MVAASFRGALVGLRCSQLGLGTSSLGVRVGVIQNDQQLALLDGVAFLCQNAPYTRRDRSVGLKVADRLNFSVGGNQAADRALLDDRGSYRHRVIAVGDESSENDHGPEDRKRCYPPPPRLASRTVSIQWHAGKNVTSMYIIHPLRGAGKCRLRTCLFRCNAQAVCVSDITQFFWNHLRPDALVRAGEPQLAAVVSARRF